MRDCFLPSGKRFELLPAFALPRRHPASVQVFADAGNPRRVVAGFFSWTGLPLARPQLFQLLLSPNPRSLEGFLFSTIGKTKIL